MGGNASTSTVGGGNATGTANNYNDFLNSLLGGGGPESTPEYKNFVAGLGQSGFPPNVQQQMISQFKQQWSAKNPTSGSGAPNPFGDAVKGALGGNVPDPTGVTDYIKKLMGQPSSFGNVDPTYKAPTFENAPVTKGQVGDWSGNGMVNMSQFNPVAGANFDTSKGMGGVASSGLDPKMLEVIKQMQGMSQNSGGGGVGALPGVSLDPAKAIDENNPVIAARRALIQKQNTNDVAELRARFGPVGVPSLGTGAQFAESNLRATAQPTEALAIQDIIDRMTGQDLAERSAKANVALGSRGQDVSMAGVNAQAAGQSAANSSSTLASALQAIMQGRGQDINAQTTSRGQDIDQLGLGLQQALANLNSSTTQRQQDISGALTNQGQGNSFEVAKRGQDNAATSDFNQILSQIFGSKNQFNLNNAGASSDDAFRTNQLNSNNFNQGIQNQLGIAGAGQNNQNTAQNSVMSILQMIFGGFNGANQLGTPQAQTVQNPSGLGQIAGLAGSLMPLLKLFGGGNNSNVIPNRTGGGYIGNNGSGVI